MVEVKKQDFERFLRRARDPLRRSVWSRLNNRNFHDLCGARATLCGDPRGQGLKTEGFSKRSRCGAVRIRLSLGEPSAEIVRVEALLLRRPCGFLARKIFPLEVVSWFARLLSQSRGRGFDSAWSAAAPAQAKQP